LGQQKEILWAFRKAFRLGAPIQDAERKLKGKSRWGVSFHWLSMLNLNLRKRDTMEIVKGVHDLAFVLVLIAIVMAPRAIDTYLAGRK
jgi:hypothetical protein